MILLLPRSKGLLGYEGRVTVLVVGQKLVEQLVLQRSFVVCRIRKYVFVSHVVQTRNRVQTTTALVVPQEGDSLGLSSLEKILPLKIYFKTN